MMGRKFWEGLGLLASIVAGAGPAAAADLAVKAPVYKAPPAIISDWAGFYIGINGGYGWGDTKFDDDFFGSLPNPKPKRGLVGGHAGYNWQYGSVVTGLEVDFDGADIKDSRPERRCVDSCYTQTMSAKFGQLATARARLGYLVLPDLLAYGTAGLGWGHSTVDERFSGGFAAEGNANNFGWVAGAGLEYKLWSNFIARAEYLHYEFGKTTYNLSEIGGGGLNDIFSARTSIDVVRGGLSYKF